MTGTNGKHGWMIGGMMLLLLIFCAFLFFFSSASVTPQPDRSGMTLRAGFYPDDGGCFGILRPQGQLSVLFSHFSGGSGIRSFPVYAALLQKSCGALLFFLFFGLQSSFLLLDFNSCFPIRFFTKLCPVRAGPRLPQEPV